MFHHSCLARASLHVEFRAFTVMRYTIQNLSTNKPDREVALSMASESAATLLKVHTCTHTAGNIPATTYMCGLLGIAVQQHSTTNAWAWTYKVIEGATR
jgi:hypothetical protein